MEKKEGEESNPIVASPKKKKKVRNLPLVLRLYKAGPSTLAVIVGEGC